MILKSSILYVALCAIFVAVGFVFAKNKSRFLLGTGVMTIAWQGGLWISPVNLELTVPYGVFALLFIWNLLNPPRKKLSKGHGVSIMVYLWGGLIAFNLFASLSAYDKNYALLGFVGTLLGLMIFFAVVRSLRTADDLKFFCLILLAALLFQGSLALVQYKFPAFRIGVIDESQSWMWWRTKGTFFHANEMGMYMLLMVPLAARTFFDSLMQGNRKWAWFAGMATLVGGLALFTTQNRGSWIGLAFGVVCMLGFDFIKSGKTSVKLKRIFMSLSVPAVLLLFFFAIKFGPLLMDRMFSENAEGSIEGRMQYQREAIAIIQANPVAGVGYKNYLHHVDSYFVHNMYLLAASEVGIPGLSFLAGFLLLFLRDIIKGMRSKMFYVSNISRGLFATFLGFLIASIPGPDFWISHPIQHYFWMLVALQVALLRIEKQALSLMKFKKMNNQGDFNEPVQQVQLQPVESPKSIASQDAERSLRNIRIRDSANRE